jgi:hypothetical protein
VQGGAAMKCLSLSANGWVERLSAKISEEEKLILMDPSEDKWEDRKRVVREIQARSQKEASQEDGRTAQSVYDSHAIKDAELIAVNIILPSLHGTINCKVGEQYKYIRF